MTNADDTQTALSAGVLNKSLVSGAKSMKSASETRQTTRGLEGYNCPLIIGRYLSAVYVGCSAFDWWIWSCRGRVSEEQKDEEAAAQRDLQSVILLP